MAVYPYHSVLSAVLAECELCLWGHVWSWYLQKAFGFQQPRLLFMLKEKRECSNFRLQSMAWFDTDQTAKKQKEQWQWKKWNNCESKPKQTEDDISDSRSNSLLHFHCIWCTTLFNLSLLLLLLIVILTIFQCGSIDLWAGGPCAGSVKSLDNHTILSKLLQVVQSVDLAIPGGLHLHNAVLAITARAVLSVTNLVTPDHTILQLFPRSLRNEKIILTSASSIHTILIYCVIINPSPNHLHKLNTLQAAKHNKVR